MPEEIPKRKIPEFDIGKQMENLKTVSAVTDVLSKDEELAKQIADVFKQVAEEKEKELVERVTNLLAEKVKGVSTEQMKAVFPFWYLCYFPPEAMSHLWTSGWRAQTLPPIPRILWYW
jgi:hypothetical protein